MVHALISYEAESPTCCNSSCISRASTFKLEAAKVNTVDICDAVVVLVVLRFADVDPFFGIRYAVDDQFRESTWIARLESWILAVDDTDNGLELLMLAAVKFWMASLFLLKVCQV
jgi:hypothetical protein